MPRKSLTGRAAYQREGRRISGNTALDSGKRNTRTLTAWHQGRDCLPILRKL